jgi:hypothetical protein
MHRRLAVLALAGLIAGCSAGQNVLPAHAVDGDDPMSMTVEQYAMSQARLPHAAATCKKPAPGVSDPAGVHGLMVWIDSLDELKNVPAILKYLPQDPNLCGASIVVEWSRIDNGPGAARQYNFAPIEAAVKPWAAAGKRVNLLFDGVNEVGPGNTATPPWVLAQSGSDKVDVVSCPNPGGGQNAGPPTPVYWERGYSKPWQAFIRATIAHYALDGRIGYMRFGVGAGAEDFPQHGADGACFPAWQAHGMSASFWAKYSTSVVRAIARDTLETYSRVQQLVALNTFDDTTAPFNVPDAVAHVAAANGVGFGTENLGAGNYGTVAVSCVKNSPVPYWCNAFDMHAGTVPLEFQPISWTLNPAFPKLAPLPQLLPYAMTNHAQIFELYAEEWLTADDPKYPTYNAHHTAWKRALTAAAAQL